MPEGECLPRIPILWRQMRRMLGGWALGPDAAVVSKGVCVWGRVMERPAGGLARAGEAAHLPGWLCTQASAGL